MSKLGLAGVSLIAAIPGGILSALLVMTYFDHATDLSGMMWAITVPTLLTSVLVTVLPVGVLLFGPKSETAEEAETAEDQPETAEEFGAADVDDFGEEDDDLSADEGDELSFDGEDDFDSGETVAADDEDLFMEDDDDFGLDMDDEEKEA